MLRFDTILLQPTKKLQVNSEKSLLAIVQIPEYKSERRSRACTERIKH